MHISTPEAARKQHALDLAVDWAKTIVNTGRHTNTVTEVQILAVAKDFDEFLAGKGAEEAK